MGRPRKEPEPPSRPDRPKCYLAEGGSGRKGGQKGGASRAAKLTPEERAASARKAAQARWKR